MIKYIFCVSPGRCGTGYLTELLSRAQNTYSTHEALPIMNGEPMIAFNQLKESQMRELTDAKWQIIERRRRKRVYCETNHSFIKGWGWLVPDRYVPQQEVGIITLRRDPEENAFSLLRLRDVPGISEFSRSWYLDPGAPRNVQSARPQADLWELCQWYIDEISRRATQFKSTFPNARYWDCELSQLNELTHVEKMFSHFELKPSPLLAAAVGRRVNTKEDWPRSSIDELLELPNAPNPDEWEGEDRDKLLRDMTNWLLEHRADQIAKLRPDPMLFGSIASAVPRVIAESERELERAFKIRLRFTETERLLLGELVYAVNPRDFAFVAIDRLTKPNIRHRYDFNFELSVGRVFKRIGFAGVLSCFASMALKDLPRFLQGIAVVAT